MRNLILAFCSCMFFFIACSDNSSILEAESQTIETRNGNCSITNIDDDPTQCDGFESFELIDDEIHITFDGDYFNNVSNCLDNVFLFDPTQTIKIDTTNCGQTEVHPNWCRETDDAVLIVDIGQVEQSGTIEMCFVTECPDFQQLMVDCINKGFESSYEPTYCPNCGASPGLGTFCFEVEITCI